MLLWDDLCFRVFVCATGDDVFDYATLTLTYPGVSVLADRNEEHVLCRLDWSQTGVLTVRPDFSRGSLPYRLVLAVNASGH